ncbi:MAG: hypothetical protein ACOYIO_09650 [Eubacteriales bacterium]|jgi:hypothetical protein
MNDTKPQTLAKKIENLWYHEKYVILAILAALIMVGFALAQSLSKKTPDIAVYHISQIGLTASSQDNFRESMKLIAKDYNGDGTVNIDFKEEVYIPEMINSSPNELSSSDKFNLELAMGDCVIYIMDESFYRGNKQYMCDLEDVLGYLPDMAYDDRALLLSALPAYKTVPGLRDFDPNSYLCLRQKRVGMKDSVYDAHVDFFKRLVEFVEFDG